ncbi:hypothetical protein DFQ26_007715 [Actinomortierella ambigua]|nr:hypothetical protein DFQ26_007715 [Actinomortierella ambigua]
MLQLGTTRAPKNNLQPSKVVPSHAPELIVASRQFTSSRPIGAPAGQSHKSAAIQPEPARLVLKEIQPNPTTVARPSWARLKHPAAPTPRPIAITASRTRPPLTIAATDASTQKPKFHRDETEPPPVARQALPQSRLITSRAAPPLKQRAPVKASISYRKIPTIVQAEEEKVAACEMQELQCFRCQKEAVSPVQVLHQVDDQEDEEFEERNSTHQTTLSVLTASIVPLPLPPSSSTSSPSSTQSSLSPKSTTIPVHATGIATQGAPSKKRQRDRVTELRAEGRRAMSSPRARLTTTDANLVTKRIKSDEAVATNSIRAPAVDVSELAVQVRCTVAIGGVVTTQSQDRSQPQAEGDAPVSGHDGGNGDDDDKRNVLGEEWCPEYAEEIIAHLFRRERDLAPPESYWTKPREHWRARATCVDVMVHLVGECRAMDEVLFLAVNFMDRYFAQSQPTLDLDTMVMVSGICVWLALKFEAKQAAYPLSSILVRMKAYMQKPFSRQDFILGERVILRQLGYELGWPGPIPFLNWVSWADGHSARMQLAARFLLEISQLFPALVMQPPSLLVAASIAVARHVAGWPDWDESLQDILGHHKEAVAPVFRNLIRVVNEPRTLSSCSFRKYSKPERGFVTNDLMMAFDPNLPS